jgi:alkylation response protein AidB-like acyl-CoA dehydrogenase
MDFSLTREQQETVGRARRVALECLEPRAAGYDESASHPWESWNDLWQSGFLAVGVPTEYGGTWVDMPTYVMVIETLAQGCTSSAMTLHMHSVVQMYVDALVNEDQKRRYYAEVVEGGKLFGSWGSEPDSRGGSGIPRGTSIAPADGGYVIDGQKHFCTMAGAAHRYMVHCTMQGYDGLAGYQLALVPSNAEGIQISGKWDTLGMRATVSPSVSFEECLVDGDCLLGEPGVALETGVGLSFGLGYAAVYIGAAQRALDLTVEYCQTHRFAPDPKLLSHSLVVQRAVAEMTTALQGARLVLYESAGRWRDADAARRMVLTSYAKYLATQAALMVTSRCLQTAGGRSAHKSIPLERLFRDVRTATLMPPNADRALEVVGRAELGVSDEPSQPGR